MAIIESEIIVPEATVGEKMATFKDSTDRHAQGLRLVDENGDPIGGSLTAPFTARGVISGTLTVNNYTSVTVVDGWYRDNVAIDLTAVVLTRSATPAFGDVWIPTRAGSITGVCVKSSGARSAGTLTVEVYKNGTGIGLTAVLDGTNTTFKATTQAVATDTFVAGDQIDVRVTTDGSWAPTTADIRASVDVQT